MSDQTKPHLLHIAPELRNRIYEYSLVGKKTGYLWTPKNRKQPALLRTCRQIREEAISIYYSQNSFSMSICNYDPTKALPFYEILKKHTVSTKKDTFHLQVCDGQNHTPVHLDNLFKWLKAYHADPTAVPSLRQDLTYDFEHSQTLARHTFGVVNSLRDKEWSTVLLILDSFREAIERMNEEAMDARKDMTPPPYAYWCYDEDQHDIREDLDDDDDEDDDGMSEDLDAGDDDDDDDDEDDEDQEDTSEDLDAGDEGICDETEYGSDEW